MQHTQIAQKLLIPVLAEESRDRHGVENLSAHCPTGPVDAVFWYLDGWETLTWQCFKGSKHGAADKCLVQLRLVHK